MTRHPDLANIIWTTLNHLGCNVNISHWLLISCEIRLTFIYSWTSRRQSGERCQFRWVTIVVSLKASSNNRLRIFRGFHWHRFSRQNAFTNVLIRQFFFFHKETLSIVPLSSGLRCMENQNWIILFFDCLTEAEMEKKNKAKNGHLLCKCNFLSRIFDFPCYCITLVYFGS